MAKKLTKKDLEAYRKLLLDRRQFITGNIEDLEDGVRPQSGTRSSGRDSLSGDTADLGSESFEQDLSLSLLENEGDVVQKIDDALGRIDDGSYGACLECATPIAKARLKAIPWTPYCIECQRRTESY